MTKSQRLLGGHDKGQIARSSGRLAAKPSYGLLAEQKALMVLLKRSGVVLHDGPPKIDELQRYRELYKKPLPPSFISAVTSLMDATSKQSSSLRINELPSQVQAAAA